MSSAADGPNTSIDLATSEIYTDDIGGHKYVVLGDIRYALPKEGPVDLNYAARYGAKLWRRGVVNIGFAQDVSEGAKTSVRRAFDMWAPAGITYNEDSTAQDCAIFKASNKNESYHGRVGGRQSVEIYNWDLPRIIAHEIGHLLGLEHEHQRSDRDNYITMNTGSIKSKYLAQFDINRNASLTTKYDLGSIMHYEQELDRSWYADGNPVPVFYVRDRNETPNYRIGQAPRPTSLDIAGIKSIYALEFATS